MGCVKKGPYYPTGETEWTCLTHNLYLIRVSGWGSIVKHGDMKCPEEIKEEKVMQHTHTCLVLDMKRDGRLPALGKHEAHPPHNWWYTSYGGGHQLSEDWEPDIVINERSWTGEDSTEGFVKRWHCPGRDVE